jgi:hypothetical protein
MMTLAYARSGKVPFALLVLAALPAFAGFTTACGPSIDPITLLEPVDVVTGWFDEGIVDGKNKLVPSVTLRFRNKSSAPVSSIQVNAIFRRVGEQEMWGEHFGWAVPRNPPLAPGAATDVLVMRSALGYTGEQPRMQMLQNREFVDAKVDIFLKTGSRVWSKLGEYPIQRQLLTR